MIMAEEYKVVAKVISQKGTCAGRQEVGREFTVCEEGEQCPQGLCPWALYAMFPFATVLRFGGSFWWEKDPYKTVVACPDARNPVVYELRRERR